MHIFAHSFTLLWYRIKTASTATATATATAAALLLLLQALLA
jgi:hypothetical protein